MDAEAIVDVLSKVEHVVWLDVLKILTDHLENTSLWEEIVVPQLEYLQYEHEISRDELATVLEQIFQLTESKIQDSYMYNLLPIEFRELFSSRNDALFVLSQRLIEATKADIQIVEIKEYLGSLPEKKLQECEDCVKSQILDQIIKIVKTPPNLIE